MYRIVLGFVNKQFLHTHGLHIFPLNSSMHNARRKWKVLLIQIWISLYVQNEKNARLFAIILCIYYMRTCRYT